MATASMTVPAASQYRNFTTEVTGQVTLISRMRVSANNHRPQAWSTGEIDHTGSVSPFSLQQTTPATSAEPYNECSSLYVGYRHHKAADTVDLFAAYTK